MKAKAILITILAYVITRTLSLSAQHLSFCDSIHSPIIELKTLTPTSDDDYSDLELLTQKIGNARIVMLGEQTHGEGTTFSAKARIVQFLHDKMGFDVILFESGMYDAAKVWEEVNNGSSTREAVRKNLFYMYAESEQVRSLFDYIDERKNTSHPLILAGTGVFNGGHYSVNNFFLDLETYLLKYNSTQHIIKHQDWSTFRALSLRLIKMHTAKPSSSEMEAFYSINNLLLSGLNEINPATSVAFQDAPGFWIKMVESLGALAVVDWENPDHHDRLLDRQAASNISWMLDNWYKDKRVIIWAHNFHIIRDAAQVYDEPDTAFKSVGQLLGEKYKGEAYVIGVSGFNGNYLDYLSDEVKPVFMAPEGSLESLLYQCQFKNALVDLSDIRIQRYTQMNGSYINSQSLYKGNLKLHMDALLFIRTSKPAIRN